jgi:hypothetical protein
MTGALCNAVAGGRALPLLPIGRLSLCGAARASLLLDLRGCSCAVAGRGPMGGGGARHHQVAGRPRAVSAMRRGASGEEIESRCDM